MNNEERFREACDKVLSEFHKLMLSTLLSMAMVELHVKPQEYWSTRDELLKWIRMEAAKDDGFFVIILGRGGGVMRRGAFPIAKDVAINATVAPLNDRVCPACGNNKCSSDERSCWKCGAAL